MRRRDALPELLCPAGDMQCLYAAIEGGADAVYVGGRAFGARAYAKNFDIDELAFAVQYAHAHGVKLYVTVNTLVFDKELPSLSDYAKRLYEIGVDAVISADLGVISEIRRRVPDLPIHASTQMTLHNSLGADAAYSLGCERVVLARELSLDNIRKTVEACKAEVEVFLHGALCVSVSGQCLMSSLVGGRSGNRGECAQPCRLPYNGKYPLSLRDLSLANHIPELIDSGVCSLKIEGRMKSPEYVYTVAKIYRTLLDEKRRATEAENRALLCAFSRGGFTDGYFTGKTEGNMTGVRSDSDKALSDSLSKRSFDCVRVPCRCECKIATGEPASLTLTLGDKSVTVKGSEPSVAITAPLTESSVKERLSKMGQTPLSLDERDIFLTLSDGVNLSPAEINSLRRRAVSALLVGRCEVNSEYIPTLLPKNANKMRSAQFFDGEVFSRLLESGRTLSFFSIAFLPLDYLLNNPEIIRCEVCKVGAALPPVIHEGELSLVRKKLEKLKETSLENVLVGNIGHIPLAKEFGFSMTGDFRLNICNSLTRQVYEGLSVSSLILSPELTASRARDIGGGVTVMGRIPLMLTERCFIRENFGCESCNKAELVDRTGAHFAIRRESDHRNIIFNSTLTYIGDRQDELSENNITHTHFIFSIESAREAEELILAYKSKKKLDFPVRRLGVRDPSKNPPERKMNKNSQKPHKRFDKKNNYSSKRTKR